MRSLKRARERARACRLKVGGTKGDLFERVKQHLEDVHGVELIPVESEFLKGGKAEVSPAEGCLFYDKKYDLNPAERLFVILHELGHLELHPRLKRRCAAPDPVYGSMYLNDGAPAMARYNRRSQDEAEANAFATEFLCPCDEAFDLWRNDPTGNSGRIARRLGIPTYIVQAQLAEALYKMSLGEKEGHDGGGRRTFKCDKSQEEAATFTGGPVLVNAGPGTGKTATLVRRIEYLLGDLGVTPESLLVLTFSTDAAEELEERVAAKFGEDVASRIKISTFHGFGVSFLQHHGHFADVDANAYILDESGQEELVTGILGDVPCGSLLKLSRPEETVKELVRHIGYLKDRLHTPETLAASLARWQPGEDERARKKAAEEFLGVFRRYEEVKTARKRLDFADLIALPIHILSEEAGLVESYRQRFKWVMVDEYQDVSRSVATLLRYLCGPDNPPWVVGDSRQSIFRFRGAAPENVDDFDKDFPGAKTFHLNTNYRSCVNVVRTANQLATLMEVPEEEENAEYAERWLTADSNPEPLADSSVTLLNADSDRAEQQGIAEQVKGWAGEGVALSEIVVLARRNIDVRNIVLALGRLGVPATTSGLVTAEGAAGDLVNIVTLADRVSASVPRLAFALGRGRYEASVINDLVKDVLAKLGDGGTLPADGYGGSDALAAEVIRAVKCLRRYRLKGDAFTKMCAFLFDGSDYLRRVLEAPDGAERALIIGEIITSLSRAAVYRFTHLDVERHVSRKGFGETFRVSLSISAPCLMPPRSSADAVRVMTCHASKGLEFPCVIVAGQTLSQAPKGYKWLPPGLQPPQDDDTKQSDSLFFVGATRAQRALVVSYANTASGTAKSKLRGVTPLLGRWHRLHEVPTVDLPPIPALRAQADMVAVWGGSLGEAFSARNLDKGSCSINTYLRDFVGVRFPLSTKPLYPIFYSTLRLALQLIVEEAQERGARLAPGDARQIFLEKWAESKVEGHVHHDIYFNLALRYVDRFAAAYEPEGDVELLSPVIGEETNFPVRLDLVAYYRTAGGTTAILFRPESLAEKCKDKGLLWGALDSKRRVPFVLLRLRDPDVRPFVFSGEDGVLYPYLWGARQADFDKESERVLGRLRLFAHGVFVEQVNEYMCDKCESRVPCPHWIEAIAVDE